ncbi:MAG: hypothetical protein JO056_04560, partial [Alphaproteobacteria bacterium]|nr:hypothetical protein [Alphaproteobacteria bacterium]
MAFERPESTERRAARDFDLLSVINGYPEQFSVFQGETIVLRVARKPGHSFPLPRLLIRALWRTGLTAALRNRALQRKVRRSKSSRRPVARVARIDVQDSLSGKSVSNRRLDAPVPIFSEMPASYKDQGANYTCRISFDTSQLPAGIYQCVVHDDRGARSEDIYINIKPRTFDDVDLLCILPSFTWQAYNRVGGGSFYSPELGHVRTVCSQRPMHHMSDNSIMPSLAILKTFENAGIRVACVDSWDLHRGLCPSGNVAVVTIMVHDEYWSAPMRAQIDDLLDRGTSLLVLSGNTC